MLQQHFSSISACKDLFAEPQDSLCGQSYTTETLLDSEKEFVDALVKKAYDNWKNIVECEGRMPLNMNQNETASSFQTGQQVFAPHQPYSVPLVPANLEPDWGGDMGLEEEFCLEDYLCPPPCKYVTLRLMLFCVVRFKRAVAGRPVELGD